MSRLLEKFRCWWTDPARVRQGELFGLGLSMALAVMSALSMRKGLMERMETLALASALLLSTALIYPRLLSLPAQAVESAFQGALKALLYVLLVMVFYLVFAPAGIMLRILNKDPLQRKREPEAETYWIDRKPADPRRVERQF